MTTVQLHHMDNVDIQVGDGGTVPNGHKQARGAIAVGEEIRKGGVTIGKASSPIANGDHVHEHNVDVWRATTTASVAATDLRTSDPVEPRTFDGYHRADGRVGIRNHILILTTVNCSASVAQAVAKQAVGRGMLDGTSNVDGVTALTHHGGCAVDPHGDSLAYLRRTLAGYATNPNTAGTVVIGLGCEANQMPQFLAETGLAEGERLRTVGIQDSGGSRAAIETALEMVTELIALADSDHRQPAPLAHLSLALQCGGSDGLSAVTANPSLGYAADLLVAHGATVVLGETPEMHGAEHILVRRAINQTVAQKLLDRLDWWRSVSEPEHNPSPGNRKGGLTTIAEKSMGAVAKAGTSPLVDVVRYAEPITTKGFVVMDSPGYDPCAVTGQIASGCTLVAFTTGRGSVSGFLPSPSLKLATNSEMARQMDDDIDIDCGPVATGESSVAEMGEAIFEYLVVTASGQQTKSESFGFGVEEFVPWQMGVIT